MPLKFGLIKSLTNLNNASILYLQLHYQLRNMTFKTKHGMAAAHLVAELQLKACEINKKKFVVFFPFLTLWGILREAITLQCLIFTPFP